MYHVPCAMCNVVLLGDVNTRTLSMPDVGSRVTAATLPADWEEQLRSIEEALAEADCAHNDGSIGNLLVSSLGRLRVVDFGLAYRASTGDSSCNGLCAAADGHKVDMRSSRPEKRYNVGLRQVVSTLLQEQRQQHEQPRGADTDLNTEL